MKRSIRTKMLSAALAWTLAAGCMPLAAYADGGSTSAAELQQMTGDGVLGSVPLPGGGTIEVRAATLLASDEGKLAAFTLTLHNEADYEIQFIDYWVRLSNGSGTTFTVQILPQDKEKNRVAPHSKLDVNLYAKVSADTELRDLVFRMVNWDFSAPNYERSLGEIRVPEEYSDLTPAGYGKVIPVSGTEVMMGVARLSAGQNSEYYLPKILMKLENNGMKTAELPAYRFSLRTAEGLLYPLQVKGLEDNNRSLHPRFSKELELTGRMPLSVGSDGWEVVVTTQNDGTGGAKLTLPVAFFSLPAPGGITDESSVPVDGAKSIDVGSGSLETKVEQVSRTKREESYAVTIDYAMKNNGEVSVTLPAFRFAVQTSEGLTYPAKAEGLKDTVIDPLFDKETKLTAVIPSSVDPQGWKLLLLPAAEQGTTNDAALAVYRLPDKDAEQGGIGRVYEFANKNGTYTARLDSIQRLPWEEQDILSASLTITNPGREPLPLPGFTGYFLLDDVVQVPAAAIVKDSVISVRAGGKVQLQLHGKIPYTNEYSSLKLVLQEKSGNDVTDLIDFRTDARVSEMPLIRLNRSFKVEGTGRQADISIRDVRIYKGKDVDLYSVQVKVQNLEKRYTSIGSFVAYLKTSDNTVYPATVSLSKSKVSPGGYSLLHVYSHLPNTLQSKDVSLVMGAGIKEGKLAAEAPDAYMDPAAYDLPSGNTPLGKMTELDFYPYTFKVKQLQVKSTTVNGFDLNVHYALDKNQLVAADTDQHKLVLEVEDKQTNIKMSKTLSLNKGGADSVNLGEGTITFQSPDIPYWFSQVSTYQFRVYEEFMGVRRLLSDQKVDYFTGTVVE